MINNYYREFSSKILSLAICFLSALPVFAVAPMITGTVVASDNTYIDVTFSEPVFNTTGGSGALEATDFTLSVTGGVANVTSVTPSLINDQGSNVYRLSFTLDQLANGSETLTVNPVDGTSIYDGSDNAASNSQSNNTVSLNDKVLPTITGTVVASDNSYIDVTFSEPEIGRAHV